MHTLVCFHRVFNTTMTIKGFKSILEAVEYFEMYFRDTGFDYEVV